MKKFLAIIICFLSVELAFAQDVIVKINGDELKVKVLEINLQEIVCQSPDTTDSSTFSIPRADVFMIRFENGTKEVFQENLPENKLALPSGDPMQMYQLGQQEARLYYKGNGALWGSAASLSIGPLGLVGPLVIGSTKPKAHKNPVSSQHLLQDPNFVRGYEKQAHKRKIGKTALGTGIGAVVMVTLLIATISSAQ